MEACNIPPKKRPIPFPGLEKKEGQIFYLFFFSSDGAEKGEKVLTPSLCFAVRKVSICTVLRVDKTGKKDKGRLLPICRK